MVKKQNLKNQQLDEGYPLKDRQERKKNNKTPRKQTSSKNEHLDCRRFFLTHRGIELFKNRKKQATKKEDRVCNSGL